MIEEISGLTLDSELDFDPSPDLDSVDIGADPLADVAKRAKREGKRRSVYRFAGSMRAAINTAPTSISSEVSILRLNGMLYGEIPAVLCPWF